MSDAPPPDRADRPAGGPATPAPLTPDAIDAVLRDFRGWLEELSAVSSQPSAEPKPTVDLFTLVGQFTALRHEVNMQTKAVRAAVELNADSLKQLAAVTSGPKPTAAPPPADDEVRSLVKALLDVGDALAVSFRQMEKLRADLDAPSPEPPKPGFFARLFGPPPVASPPSERALQLMTAAADGYAMGLRRVERALAAAGLEPIPAAGRAFDPELMEVVDVAADTDDPPGTVVAEVRAGYRWRGKLFRFAQVKVAK